MEEKIASQLLNYFFTLDQVLEKASNLKEKRLTRLPSWHLTYRNIKVGITPNCRGIVIKVSPNPNLEHDAIFIGTISNNKELNALLSPFGTNMDISQISEDPGLIFGNFTITPENPMLPPPETDKSMLAYGNITKILDHFTQAKAYDEALTYLNSEDIQGKKNGSYIGEVKTIFLRFQLMIKQKAFLERRVHRYLKEYSKYLLPSFKHCYFEQDIFLGKEKRTADFILEREAGFPPILVELESPVHKVFRKNLDFTAEVNHAKSQIAEWVRFIDNDPLRNASGDFSFLTGPKERLVVIGKGLDHKEHLIASKHTDTTIWTYDLLLEQARERMNSEIMNQCQLIGIDINKPF